MLRLVLSILLAMSVSANAASLGADCGIGASFTAMQDKSSLAGKITLGQGTSGIDFDSCTLFFGTWPAGARVPSCVVTHESGPVHPDTGSIRTPYSAGAVTTATLLYIPEYSTRNDMRQGDVFSYLCLAP